MLFTQLEQPVSVDLLGGVCVLQLPERHCAQAVTVGTSNAHTGTQMLEAF